MIIQYVIKLVLLLGLINSSWAIPLASENTIPSPQNEEAAYQRGLEKLIAGDLSGAEQAFHESMVNRPQSASPLLGLAEIAFQRKQFDKTGTLLQQAINIEPNNAYAQMSLGRYLKLNKKYPEAEQAFLKSADLDSKSILPRIALGDLYLTYLAKPDAAVNAYESALKLDPNNAAAHYAMGVAQAKLGNGERSITELRKAGELDTKNPLPSIELARVNLLLKKPDDALNAINEALKIDANSVNAQLLRADILLAKGNISSAEQEYTDLKSKHPELSSPLLHLAMLQQQVGHLDAATKSYQSAIKVDPKLALAYNNLAWILNIQRKNQEAEHMARKAVELEPKVAQFFDTLGWVYRNNKKQLEARETLEKALTLAPSDAVIMAHLGIVLNESGDRTRALALLQKALGKDDNFPEALEAKNVLQELTKANGSTQD